MRRPTFVASLAATAAATTVQRYALAEETGTVILIASAADDDVTPILWADRAGWFKDAGITIRVDRLNSGSSVAAAVAGGAINVGKASMLAVILAHTRGLPLVIVGPGGLATAKTNNSGLLVRKDSPIRKAGDLSGKLVSVPALNDLQALATQAWIDKNGGNSKEISFIEEPGSSVGIALDANRIAAGTLANPAFTRDMATGHYRNIGRPISGISDRLMISAWICDAGWSSKNAAVVRKFGEILARASVYVNAHHDQTIDLIAGFSGMERETVKTMARAIFPDRLDPSLVQPLIDVALKYGAIKQSFNAAELFSADAFALKKPT